jgi:hypothetical protein
MNNPADHPSVINTMRSRLIFWEQGRNRRPLIIVKKKRYTHASAPTASRSESQVRAVSLDLIGFEA